MVKSKIKVSRSFTISSKSSFIENIVVENETATVSMKPLSLKDKRVKYVYNIDSKLKDLLISAGKNDESLGKFYNQHLRKRSIAKIITF